MLSVANELHLLTFIFDNETFKSTIDNVEYDLYRLKYLETKFMVLKLNSQASVSQLKFLTINAWR